MNFFVVDDVVSINQKFEPVVAYFSLLFTNGCTFGIVLVIVTKIKK